MLQEKQIDSEVHAVLLRVVSRFLNQRQGTSIRPVRTRLLEKRHVLDKLVSDGYLAISGGDYLPTFRLVTEIDPEIARLATTAVNTVLVALRNLYIRDEHKNEFFLNEIVDEVRRCAPALDERDVIPALLLAMEFPYFASWSTPPAADGRIGVRVVQLTESILDFRDVGEAWQRISTARYRLAPPQAVHTTASDELAPSLLGEVTDASEPDDSEFARLAIEEARKSVSEDGRVHPRVGVVVVKDGQVLATAHRGEFPQCHAEYIALEKKLADVPLAGATVYTTLEPCTSRNHPKVPCAVRLAERRVGRVLIGMLDPDDRISGRGQRALRKAGIATELFPHELMAEVEDLNRDFTRDRESRASETGSGPSQELADRVHFVPDAFNNGWAQSGNQVELRLGGTFTHEGTGTLSVLQAFLEGTKPTTEMIAQVITERGLGTPVALSYLDLDAHNPVRAIISVRVSPLVGIRGEVLSGRFIFRDNYNRDYPFDVSLPYIGPRC